MSASPSVPETILVLKPSSLGDIVHTLPAVALLRHQWPESKIIWMVNPEWAPLLQDNPLRIEPWIFRRKEFGGISGLLRCGGWIRDRPFARPDLALDFQGLLRSALIGKLVQPSLFLGLSDAREGARLFYHRRANVGTEHAVDRYLKLVREAGVDPVGSALEWPLPVGEPVVGTPDRFILLHPFSRGKGKSLDLRAVETLCDALNPIPILLAGRAEETVPPKANVINLLNQTSLPQLIWLLRKASYVISVDSGPMHLAAALTSRLLSIHTWSDPRLVGPYSPHAHVWKGGSIQRMDSYQPAGAAHVPSGCDLLQIAEHAKQELLG